MHGPEGRTRAGPPSPVVLLAAVLLAVVTGCAPAPPPEPPPVGSASAWVTDSLTRVGLRDAPRPGSEARITALRGETESFQIVVSGGATGVAGLDVVVGDLTGRAGTVPASAVTRFREHYVDVTESSPDGGGRSRPLPAGQFPDVLVPFTDPDTGAPLHGRIRAAGASVTAGRNQPYWVDVTVPPDAATGEYVGHWTVHGTGGFTASGTVRLSVADAALPARPALHSAVLNGSGRQAVSRELLRNRITPTSARPGPGDPLSAVITTTDTGFFSGADQYVCQLDPPPAPAEVAAVAARAAPGTLLFNYTADEIGNCPDLRPEVQAWGRALHAGGVAQLLTQTPDPALFDDGTGRTAVDIWVVLPKQYDADPAAVREALGRGMQVWSYNALVQDTYSPKWLIDFPPLDLRIQPGFLNQSLGLTGLLYWRADNWVQDVWADVHTYSGGYPGEGLLVYPGEEVGLPGGAVPSIRLKWLRDGVDDYDYIDLARARGHGRAVTGIVSTVARSWSDWSPDPAVLRAARAELVPLVTNAG